MILSNLILYLSITIIVLGLLYGSLLKFYSRKKESGLLSKILELEKVMKNSHFLYGGLNSIKHYMLSHSQLETAEYLTEFTNLLKNLSINSKQKNITLAEEIETLILYLEIEKKKVGKDFVFVKEIDSKLETNKIFVKPLFAFRELENLIQEENTKNEKSIYLIVRQLGKKIDCFTEILNSKSYIIIIVPE